MKWQPIYDQNNIQEIMRLVGFSQTCLLITKDGDIGVFNPFVVGDRIYLHHSKGDPQVGVMRKNHDSKLVFNDVLGVLPSYWFGNEYAGASTTYYRYAELDCDVTLIEEPRGQVPLLEKMMEIYQPEGIYTKIDHQAAIYENALKRILVSEFKITGTRAKWKLCQNKSKEEREAIAQKFRQRNCGNDSRAADEIERWGRLSG